MSRKDENQEKKKKTDFVSVLAVIMLIIAIIMIIAALGFGGGSGNGDGSGNSGTNISESTDNQEDSGETPEKEISATEESSAEESETEVSPEKLIYIQVTVSGNTYVMDDAETTLDAVIESASGDNIVVRITDDNAVADAMDSLISALDEKGIQYIELTAE